MNIIPSTCVLTILSNIYPVDGSTGINELYRDIQHHNKFKKEHKFNYKWNNYQISYEKTWDALTCIEKLYESSDESTKAIISSKYDMEKIREIKDTIIDTLMSNVKYNIIIQSDYEKYRENTWSRYIKNNKQIINRKVYIKPTCSTQYCIGCNQMLPFDWESREEYKFATCSYKCSSKFPSLTHKCAYNRCDIEMPLYECDNFCSDYCASDDYEDNHTFNRIDAYLDRHC